MDNNEIFNIVKKFILEQLEDEVEEIEIKEEKSMKELGATSLDIVEIVTNTIREIKVKIPREQLSKIKTIGELVSTIKDIQK